MLLFSVVVAVMSAIDLIRFAVTGDIAYVSGKYRMQATGTPAVIVEIAMFVVSILLGVVGWRDVRRG